MRRTGSTLLHEKGFPSDVIEKALNHTIGGVRGVYNKAQYSNQRQEMLQHWADYIDGLALNDANTMPKVGSIQPGNTLLRQSGYPWGQAELQV